MLKAGSNLKRIVTICRPGAYGQEKSRKTVFLRTVRKSHRILLKLEESQ